MLRFGVKQRKVKKVKGEKVKKFVSGVKVSFDLSKNSNYLNCLIFDCRKSKLFHLFTLQSLTKIALPRL